MSEHRDMSNELQRSEAGRPELPAVPTKAGGNIAAFIPQTAEEIKWTVGMIVGAKLAPDSYRGDQRAMAVGIMKGLEVGLPPITALENIAVINGRPTIWGDGVAALLHSKGVLAGYEEAEIGTPPGDADEVAAFADDYGFEVRMHRKGVEGAFVGRFTVSDAKRAKLWANPKRGPWMQYPKRMLRMRAFGFAVRNGFADCLAGMMIREEVEDLPTAPPPKSDTGYLDDEPEELEHTETPDERPAEVAPEGEQSPGEASAEPTGDGVLSDPGAVSFPYLKPDGEVMHTYATASEFVEALDSGVWDAGPDSKAWWAANAELAEQIAREHSDLTDMVNAIKLRQQG